MDPIHGERVTVRAGSEVERETLAAIAATPEIVRTWGPDVDVDDMLAIVVGGEVVGGIQYGEETDPQYRHANIDIFVDPRHHGRGICTDAVRTLARWLIRERGHHRITIDPAASNTAAIRCYEKAGFKPVGLMRKYEQDMLTATWHDGLLMDLLADDTAP